MGRSGSSTGSRRAGGLKSHSRMYALASEETGAGVGPRHSARRATAVGTALPGYARRRAVAALRVRPLCVPPPGAQSPNRRSAPQSHWRVINKNNIPPDRFSY